jgi:hypothetical protein
VKKVHLGVPGCVGRNRVTLFRDSAGFSGIRRENDRSV